MRTYDSDSAMAKLKWSALSARRDEHILKLVKNASKVIFHSISKITLVLTIHSARVLLDKVISYRS